MKTYPMRDYTFTVTARTNDVDKAFKVRDEVASSLQDAADSHLIISNWDVGTLSVECIRASEEAAPPPSPCTVVAVATPIMGYNQFRAAYMYAYESSGDSWTEAELAASWQAYQRSPAGHFLSKP